MKLFAWHSPPFDLMAKDYFLGTMQDKFELELERVPVANNGEFGTKEFRDLHMRSYARVIEFLRQNKGESVFICGVDIQWFGKVIEALEHQLQNFDILFQRDHAGSDEINDGIVVARANDKVIAFYEEALAKVSESDELMLLSSMRRMLAAGQANLRHGLLDHRFYARPHGDPPPDILLHHACNCPGRNGAVAEKIKFMDEVRAKVGAKPVIKTAGPRISIITTCKGRLESLQQTFPWNALQIQGSEYVFVDYKCPQKSGDWVEAQNIANVRVIRASPDSESFHHSKARNIGAAAATGTHLMFVDCDVKLTPQSDFRLSYCASGRFYDGRRSTCFGLILCRAADFKNVGGYLEKLSGWGGDDTCLKWALEATGLKRISLLSKECHHIAHPEEQRTQYFEEKNREASAAANLKILTAHLDATKFRPWTEISG